MSAIPLKTIMKAEVSRDRLVDGWHEPVQKKPPPPPQAPWVETKFSTLSGHLTICLLTESSQAGQEKLLNQ